MKCIGALHRSLMFLFSLFPILLSFLPFPPLPPVLQLGRVRSWGEPHAALCQRDPGDQQRHLPRHEGTGGLWPLKGLKDGLVRHVTHEPPTPYRLFCCELMASARCGDV